MKSFQEIYQIASLHKGGDKNLESVLPKAKTARQLRAFADDRYLSNLCRRVFRAGLKHSLVDAKWPAFEEAFKNFEPMYCAMLSDDDIDILMTNKKLIRHLGKIKSVRTNAQMLLQVKERYDSFGEFLAQWPEEDIVGLWLYLKKHGQQLGGNSGPAFLRMVDKDTFLLTNDVVAVLKNEGVLEKIPTAQRDLRAAEKAFLTWREQSGRSYCEISRVVSCAAL